MLIVLCSLLLVTLVGCGKKMERVEGNNSNTSMFVMIENGGIFKVVYNKYTKVMYTVSTQPYNQGNFTLLVNADGTPMLYEKDLYESGY